MRKKGSLTIAILALAVLTLIPVLSACDHTHTPVHMEAYEGSCTEQGNIECWYCGGCGKYFADENCNEELPEKDVFTGEKHNWDDWQIMTDTTCSTGGLQMRQCLDCKKTEEQLIAAQHAWDDWHVAKQPTCKTDGQRIRRCLRCSAQESEAIPASGAYHKYNSRYYCIYCGKLSDEMQGALSAKNAPFVTAANWSRYDNKTATTTITITDLEIAFGIDGDDKAICVTAGAQVDITRTWNDGTLTIDIVARLTDFDITLNDDPALNGIIEGENALIDVAAMKNIKFTGQAFYNYAGEEKTIGVRNLQVEGLAQAIPALKEIITEDPWHIYFDEDRQVREIRCDLAELNKMLNEGTVGNVIEGIFDENYTFDIVSIIDDLLLNQTMLNFGDPANAILQNGQYINNVSALDNLGFLTDVWNNITADGKAMLQELFGPESEIEIGGFILPIGEILSIFLSDDQFGDLLPNLIQEAVTDGSMSVTGTVENDMFKTLTMTTTGVSIDLDKNEVNKLADVIKGMLPAAGVTINGAPLDMDGIINAVAGKPAYISFGTIAVDSTFTVNK